jgi:hypothetical protein
MRKIVAGMFITLDGVVEAPEKWNPPYYDDELSQAVMRQLAAAGTHLYGRRSYELFRCSTGRAGGCRSRSSNPGRTGTVSWRSATRQPAERGVGQARASQSAARLASAARSAEFLVREAAWRNSAAASA